MPNEKHLVLCPYYKRNMSRSISCEDVYRTFSDTEKKEMWMRSYCDKDWESCKYAIELNEAYERYFKGDNLAIMDNEMKALRKEIKNLSTKLGKSEKRVERQQKKIDEQRELVKSYQRRNDELYRKWRDADALHRKQDDKIWGELGSLSDIYEQRMCYLIDTYAEGRFYDKSAEEWAGDKEFTLVHDADEDGRYWKVVFKEDVEDNNVQDAEEQGEQE